MGQAPLANVYLHPATNFVLQTTPGRKVDFHGGNAKIFDARDMPHILRLPNATVEMERRWVDWLPGWLLSCNEFNPPRAAIIMPEGCSMTPWPDCTLTIEDGVFALLPDELPVPDDAPAPGWDLPPAEPKQAPSRAAAKPKARKRTATKPKAKARAKAP